jgi:hypothetical protein
MNALSFVEHYTRCPLFGSTRFGPDFTCDLPVGKIIVDEFTASTMRASRAFDTSAIAFEPDISRRDRQIMRRPSCSTPDIESSCVGLDHVARTHQISVLLVQLNRTIVRAPGGRERYRTSKKESNC